jgi:hypothetical protein
MKEPCSISANFFAAFSEAKTAIPQIEVCLVVSEPAYSIDLTGDVFRRRDVSQFRFVASPETLRKLCKSLEEFAREAESLNITVQPNKETK